MIKEFSIKNFKCFKEIVMRPWERINLIAGKNNVGKTTVLEAIWLHEGAHNAQLALTVEKFRGITSFDLESFLDELFTEFRRENQIELTARYQDGKSLVAKITPIKSTGVRPIVVEGTDLERSAGLQFEARDDRDTIRKSQFFWSLDSEGKPSLQFKGSGKALRPRAILVSTGFSKEDKNRINAERFSRQVEAKRKGDIVDSLRLVDDRLIGLELVKRGHQDVICGDIGHDKMLPLSLMGEGMERYLTFVLAILDAENGIVLIDEIENGFHHSIYPKIWTNLAKLSRKYNVQLITTTHSYECVEAAHTSFKGNEQYDFVLHRLDRVDDKIEDVTYEQETLEAALKGDLEIR
jgi:predicted ATP-dependent endonuclease of OLD family